MLRKAFADRIGTTPKVAIANIVLVANAFIWYFYAFSFLSNLANQTSYSLMVLGVNFSAVLVSAFFGAYLIDKFKKRVNFLRYWMLAGTVLSVIPILPNIANPTLLISISAVLGSYFGLGMPICLGYFAATTQASNRARLGGVTVLLIGIGLFVLNSLSLGDVGRTALILGMLRTSGLLIFVLLKPSEKPIDPNNIGSYRSVFKNRGFLLYFVPWCMFALVNNMSAPLISKIFGDLVSFSWIEYVIAGTFAVIAGFVGDFLGRKRLTLLGFALLGIGYGVLAFFPGGSSFGWWFYTIADGVAFGSFLTVFLLTIWGDIAQEQSSERFYTIGSLPYLLSSFIQFSLGDTLASASIDQSAIFSFASFFLFVAVLPMVYAPETLPEKVMKDRDLKSYVEKAMKKMQNETGEIHNSVLGKPNEDCPEFRVKTEEEEETSEYEEARKLAEEYY